LGWAGVGYCVREEGGQGEEEEVWAEARWRPRLGGGLFSFFYSVFSYFGIVFPFKTVLQI
jgi:hypothetical protein